MNLKFQSQSNVISGSHGSKLINVKFRQTTGGPPPGNYTILPPTKDPVFGLVATMVPVGSAGPAGMKELPGALGHKDLSAAALMRRDVASGKMIASGKMDVPGGKIEMVHSGKLPSSGSFVISDRQIAGRNCLIAERGFSDLMMALQSGGPAMLTVV